MWTKHILPKINIDTWNQHIHYIQHINIQTCYSKNPVDYLMLQVFQLYHCTKPSQSFILQNMFPGFPNPHGGQRQKFTAQRVTKGFRQGQTLKVKKGQSWKNKDPGASGIFSGWCSTLTLLLICSSFSRENVHLLLICSSLSTTQIFNGWWWWCFLLVGVESSEEEWG